MQPSAPAPLRQNLAEAYALSGRDADAENVLKIDHKPAQVKKLLAHYRLMREKAAKAAAISAPPPVQAPVHPSPIETAPSSSPSSPPGLIYANLGSFSSADLAEARLDKLKEQFGGALGNAHLTVVAYGEKEGDPADYYVRAIDFSDLASAHAFCKTLEKGAAFCKVYGK